ncbi:UNVERIFIED_CONTAM: Piriformospora indica-insensitive protein 2 [Sesamum radiatum]|uniref:Piriformospora indica-insensitive protein 2 n=1 Tax=Sesamum radiatum TaxID=300843 RepID=A0AAW2JQ86_SESRA
MKKIKSLRFSVLVLCVFYLSVWCNGEDESVGAPMKRTEVEALYSAVQAFVGKWWNGSDLYPDPCGWTPIQGVSCDLFDGFWYVTELRFGPLHDNSLSCAQNAEFSPHLFALRRLKALSFFSCFVSPRRYPVSIPTQNWEVLAASLESLEFRSNLGLTGRIPSTFGELKNLRSLVLLENGLTGELQANLGNLINLRRLNLAGNSFTGRIPENFGGLNSLLILDMSRNSLSGSLPLSFGGLNSLLKLDLSYNKLEGKVPEELGNLKKLTLLDLSNNRFSGGLTKSLQNLCSLEELALSNNPTGGDLMSLEWQNLRGLAALDLSNMSLTGGIPESIAGLKGLRFLGLNDNKLTGDIPPKLASLPNVSALYLHGNNLTGEIKFSEWFYGKLGRRFGAWDNPNLCYPIGLMPTSYAPFGVKLCQQEIMKYETHLDSKLGNGNWNHIDSKPMVSLGFSVCGVSGLVFLVEVLMVLVLCFSSYD